MEQMDFEIVGPPVRDDNLKQRDGETGLRIPLNRVPDETLMRQLTRAPELDHKVFAPSAEGTNLLIGVRTSELQNPTAFMNLISDVIRQINGERRRRLEQIARQRAEEEQRKARLTQQIDHGLDEWWRMRAPSPQAAPQSNRTAGA